MALPFIQKFNFHNCLYEAQALPECYSTAGLDGLGRLPVASGLCIVHLIPPYINSELSKISPKYRCFSIYNHLDYLIDLSVSPDADTLFRKVLERRQYKNMRRLRRRLAEEINLKEKIFFGTIDRAEYSYLMERFRSMIQARFAQRNLKHDALKRWGEYLDITYGMILEKRASLIVYYNDLQPIAMGLNFHFGRTLFSAITTYDIRYEKYGLGIQMIMEKIQWSFEMGINLVDLGWGDLKHKEAFSNRVEAYRVDIVYPVGKPWLIPMAYALVKAIRMKSYLKKLTGKP